MDYLIEVDLKLRFKTEPGAKEFQHSLTEFLKTYRVWVERARIDRLESRDLQISEAE